MGNKTRIATRALLVAVLLLANAMIAAKAGNKKPVDRQALAREMWQGAALLKKHDYAGSLKAYQKAEKISHHTCAQCQFQIGAIYKRAGDFDSALRAAKKAVKESGDDKSSTASANLFCATLLNAMASKPKDRKLAQAIANVRAALALEPQNPVAQFDLGFLLVKQEKDAQGIAELNALVASGYGDAALAAKARQIISNPLRAREPFAPDFSFTTLEGQQVSLASLHGKVALLDFWGTWCPPCRASIPILVSLHKQYASKPVVFVGISSDNNQQAWQKFIVANHMDWPEYIDLTDKVQQAFGVDSFPTYIVLDRGGVIRFRQSGFSEMETDASLEGAINKALKEKMQGAR